MGLILHGKSNDLVALAISPMEHAFDWLLKENAQFEQSLLKIRKIKKV